MSQQTVPQHQVDWPGGSPSVRHADGDATTAGRESTVKALGGGSMAEAVAGLGAGVLAIIGLVGTAPERLGAIAAIVIGGGLLARGAAVPPLKGTDSNNILIGVGFAMSQAGSGDSSFATLQDEALPRPCPEGNLRGCH